MKKLPETYPAGGYTWRFVEQIENWAIYRKDQPADCKTSPSHEVVRTNVRDFPPPTDSWGTDGFSFTDLDSLGNARTHIRKLLAGSNRSKCKNGVAALSGAANTMTAATA